MASRLLFCSLFVFSTIFSGSFGSYKDKNGKDVEWPCKDGQEMFFDKYTFVCENGNAILKSCTYNGKSYKAGQAVDENNMRIIYCKQEGSMLKKMIIGCVTDDGDFLTGAVESKIQKDGSNFTCTRWPDGNGYSYSRSWSNSYRIDGCKPADKPEISRGRYLFGCEKGSDGTYQKVFKGCLAKENDSSSVVGVDQTYDDVEPNHNGFRFKCRVEGNMYIYEPIGCLTQNKNYVEPGKTFNTSDTALICIKEGNTLKIQTYYSYGYGGVVGGGAGGHGSGSGSGGYGGGVIGGGKGGDTGGGEGGYGGSFFYIGHINLGGYGSYGGFGECDSDKKYIEGSFQFECVKGKFPKLIACVFFENKTIIQPGSTFDEPYAYRYKCEYNEKKNGLSFYPYACLDDQNRPLQPGQNVTLTDGSRIICKWNENHQLVRISIGAGHGSGKQCAGDTKVVQNYLGYECKNGYLSVIGCAPYNNLTVILEPGKSHDSANYRFECKRQGGYFQYYPTGCIDTEGKFLPIGETRTIKDVTIKCIRKGERVYRYVENGIGCVHPFLAGKLIRPNGDFYIPRTINGVTFQIQFRCTVDFESNLYRFEQIGVNYNGITYKVGQYFEVNGYYFQVIIYEFTGEYQVNIVTESQTICRIGGKTYKHNEKWKSPTGITNYRCYFGKVIKESCNVGEKVIPRGQIMYCNNHPYLCNEEGEGAIALPFYGCTRKNGSAILIGDSYIEHSIKYTCTYQFQQTTIIPVIIASGCIYGNQFISVGGFLQVGGSSGYYIVCSTDTTTYEVIIRNGTESELKCIKEFNKIPCKYTETGVPVVTVAPEITFGTTIQGGAGGSDNVTLPGGGNGGGSTATPGEGGRVTEEGRVTGGHGHTGGGENGGYTIPNGGGSTATPDQNEKTKPTGDGHHTTNGGGDGGETLPTGDSYHTKPNNEGTTSNPDNEGQKTTSGVDNHGSTGPIGHGGSTDHENGDRTTPGTGNHGSTDTSVPSSEATTPDRSMEGSSPKGGDEETGQTGITGYSAPGGNGETTPNGGGQQTGGSEGPGGEKTTPGGPGGEGSIPGGPNGHGSTPGGPGGEGSTPGGPGGEGSTPGGPGGEGSTPGGPGGEGSTPGGPGGEGTTPGGPGSEGSTPGGPGGEGSTPGGPNGHGSTPGGPGGEGSTPGGPRGHETTPASPDDGHKDTIPAVDKSTPDNGNSGTTPGEPGESGTTPNYPNIVCVPSSLQDVINKHNIKLGPRLAIQLLNRVTKFSRDELDQLESAFKSSGLTDVQLKRVHHAVVIYKEQIAKAGQSASANSDCKDRIDYTNSLIDYLTHQHSCLEDKPGATQATGNGYGHH